MAAALLGVVAMLGLVPPRPGVGVALGAPAAAASSTTYAGTSPVATTTTTPATTATVRGPRGSGQSVTIAFAGDSHFEAQLRARLQHEGTAMLDPLAPLWADADVTVVNLETSITERGAPQPKEWTFRAPPEALDALAGAGVDAVSMANNHGLDYGPEGLQDSLAARAAAPLSVIGIGRDAADAYTPYRTTVRGQRITVIAATQVLDEELIGSWTALDAVAGGRSGNPGLASAKDVDRLTREVARARAESDTVVVFLHWGQEREQCPTARQRDLASALVAAGADIVVGSHAHRLLGAGRMGEAFVGYGLGNFIWFNGSGANGDTGALLVTATGRHIDGYEWRPARVGDGVPTPLEGEAATRARASWEQLRACTGLTP